MSFSVCEFCVVGAPVFPAYSCFFRDKDFLMSGPQMNSLPKEPYAAGATNSTDVADYSDSQLADTAMSTSSTHPAFGFTNGLSAELESLFGKEVDAVAHLREDAHPDAELTKCVVALRMLLVESKCPQWPEFIRRVALGVLLMSTTRDINMQEMVHFPNLSQGDTHLRSREWQTFLYDNGAFRLFNGVMPESVLQRSREYAEIVEGCLWYLGRRPVSREEAKIIAELDTVFRAITIESADDSSAELGGSGVGVEEAPRGIKRKRTWLAPPSGDIANLPDELGESKIICALREHALEMWCSGKPSADRLKFWGAQEALNCQAMLKKLMAKVETTEIMEI